MAAQGPPVPEAETQAQDAVASIGSDSLSLAVRRQAVRERRRPPARTFHASEWQANFCLYAYLHPERNWLLYIGKADYQTVRQRLHGEHKDELFTFLRRKYGIDCVEVIQGDLVLKEGRRRSSELLALVESLLIMRLQPPGNVVNIESRVYRPGLRVKCLGDWPLNRSGFRDLG